MPKPAPTLREAARHLNTLVSRGDKLRMAALGVGMLIGALLETVSLGAVPVFLSVLVDPTGGINVLPFDLAGLVSAFPAGEVVLWGSVLLLVIFIIKNLFLAALITASAVVLRNICIKTTNRLFRAYMRGAYGLHLQRNSTHSIRNLTTEMAQFRIALNAVLIAGREGAVMVCLSLLLVIADPIVSVPTVLFLAVTAVVAFVAIRRRLSKGGQALLDYRGSQMQIASQAIGALKVARVLGHESLLERRFGLVSAAQEGAAVWTRVLPAMPRLVLEVVAISAILLIVFISLGLGRGVAEILPILVLISISIVRLVPVLTQLTAATSQLTIGAAAVRKIATEIDAFEETFTLGSSEQTLLSNAPALPHPELLAVEAITFTFPGAPEPTLSDVSLTLRKGQSIGLIGPSGAGKSTLVDIVLGVSAPQSGSICVDGLNLAEHPERRQNLFGYVPQDIYLLDDTIRQNVGFGLDVADMNDARLWDALDKAHLSAFVRDLPDGLETVVGDRGARLSGGQRQRLGIARALYHEPAILVLDEATSALDTETEEAVVAAIRDLKGVVTLLTIAHRLSTLADCDVIYRLEKGRVVASGTLDQVAPETKKRHTA